MSETINTLDDALIDEFTRNRDWYEERKNISKWYKKFLGGEFLHDALFFLLVFPWFQLTLHPYQCDEILVFGIFVWLIQMLRYSYRIDVVEV